MRFLLRRFGRRKGHPGFTMIELLVVISIIAILATLLLTALKKAMATGRNAKCRNNLHQMHVLASAAMPRTRGYFPSLSMMEQRVANDITFWDRMTTTHWTAYRYFSDGESLAGEDPPGWPSNGIMWYGIFTNAVGTSAVPDDIFICPCDKRTWKRWLPTASKFSSYKDGVHNVNDPNAFRSVSVTGRSETVILYIDDVPQTDYRHDPKKVVRNVVFVDGHVSSTNKPTP